MADRDAQQQFAIAAEAVAIRQNLQVVRLLTMLLGKKISLLLWGLAGAVLAFCISLPLRPYFTATTRVLPPQTRSSTAVGVLGQLSLGGDSGGLASLGSALQSKSQGDSFVVLLTAWPVLDTVIHDLDLQSVYKAHTLQGARAILDGNTNCASEKGFVTITVKDGNAERAAAIANDYIRAVRDSMRGMALTEASQRRMFYEEQLEKAKEELSQAEVNFTAMQKSSKMVTIDSQARTLLESAATLRSQMTAQEVELQRLRTYLTEDNPQLQVAQTGLAALRTQLAQVESQSRGGGFTGGALSGVPGAELDYVRATREVKYREALYELMAKQYEASRIDEARTAPVVQVVEPAFAPEQKTGPHRLLFALGGFLVGFGLRFVLAIYGFWRAGLDPEERQRLADIRHAAFRLH